MLTPPPPSLIRVNTDEISGAVAPTALFNLLDNPAVTLPVLRVDAQLDAASNSKPSPYWQQANFKVSPPPTCARCPPPPHPLSAAAVVGASTHRCAHVC
jgi:hypothetical protein